MSAPKGRCPECLEPVADCCCPEDDLEAAPPAGASGLTVLRVPAEGASGDPGESPDDVYLIES